MEKKDKLVLEPENVSPIAKKIMDYTMQTRLPLWLNNLAEHFTEVRRGLDITELKRSPDKPAVLVGAGPNVWKHNHLKMLAESNFKGVVIATDRMLIPCLKAGIVPKYVASVDGSPKIAEFYDDKLVDENARRISAVLNITVYPNVAKKFKGKKYWFISMYDNPLVTAKGKQRLNPKSITMILHFLTKKFMMVTLGQCGGFIWNLGNYVGCTPLILIGYDYSYATLKPEKTSYWQAYLKLTGGKKKKARNVYHVETNPIYKTKYLMEPIWMTYRELFKVYLEKAKQLGFRTVNATEGGALWGDWIENMRFKDALEQFGG